jgi:predicted glutamine amidotransferase
MCIIIGKVSGVKFPKDEYLKTSESHNSDGIGIAYHKFGTDKVIIKKDFKDVNDLIKFQNENLKEEDSVLYHFRFATHGLKDEGNRHPFPASKDENLLRSVNLETNLAIAHNGVLSEYSDKKNKLSDTQLFIGEIMSDEVIINNINNEVILSLIAERVSPSRLAIMQKNGDIIFLNTFTEEDGCLYSNTNYKTPKFNYLNTNYSSGWSYQGEYGAYGHGYGLPSTLDAQDAKAIKALNNKSYANIVKSTAYKAKCDDCAKEQHVMDVESGDVILKLCKKCRKRFRKDEKERNLTDKPPTQDSEMYYCASCQTYYPKKGMISITQGIYSCEACFTSLTLE